MSASPNRKFAILLSGCGHKDGAEITEAVSVILALSEASCSYEFFAPDVEFKVRDPLTGSPTDESRNVLLEAARITRGDIHPLDLLKADQFDGLILPGGSGAASVLSSFAISGANGKALPLVEKILVNFHEAGRPILAICIAPALVALVLGKKGVTVTVGEVGEAAEEIKKTGAHVEPCPVNDFITDREHKIITTPAYMYGEAAPFEVYTGIHNAVRELVEMA
jgi:enhancing lycopene biosynthesis protein 2